MTRIFFDVLELNLGITVVILILGILSGKLRKRYGAGCMKWLWMLLAVRLLIPYNFSLPNTELRLFDSPDFAQEEKRNLTHRTDVCSCIADDFLRVLWVSAGGNRRGSILCGGGRGARLYSGEPGASH